MSLTTLIATTVLSLAMGQAGTAQPLATQPSTPPAATSQPASPPVSESIASKDGDDKMVCRKVRATGSNMITRDCRTVGQRRRDAEIAKDALRNGQSINNLDTGSR